jgi:Na+/proline symporter
VASGAGGLGASLAAVPAERLALADVPMLEMIERFAVPVCGTIVAVELVSRMLGCRSAETARRATVAGGVLYLVIGLIPVYIGLIGPTLVPGLSGETAEQLMPEVARKLLPGFAFVLFAGALISAILSTVDSVLLASAAQLSRNILLRRFPAASEATKVRTARVSVVALAVVASVLAITATSIRELVEVASAAGSTGILVSLLFGLHSRFGGAPSAAAAIVTGAVVWAIGHITEATATPYLLSLASAIFAYVAAAVARPNREAAPGSGGIDAGPDQSLTVMLQRNER